MFLVLDRPSEHRHQLGIKTSHMPVRAAAAYVSLDKFHFRHLRQNNSRRKFFLLCFVVFEYIYACHFFVVADFLPFMDAISSSAQHADWFNNTNFFAFCSSSFLRIVLFAVAVVVCLKSFDPLGECAARICRLRPYIIII